MYIDSGNVVFLHFGTLAEVLDHLEDDKGGWLARNYFTAIPNYDTYDVAPSPVILVADLQKVFQLELEVWFLIACLIVPYK